MSVKISALAWSARLPKINGPKGSSPAVEKLVLLRLAEFASDDGASIYPSRERIAADCELGKDAVRSAIDQLVSRGILVKVRSSSGLHRRAAEYRIDVDALRACVELQEEEADPVERNCHTPAIPAHDTIQRNGHSAAIPSYEGDPGPYSGIGGPHTAEFPAHIGRNYPPHTAELPAPIDRQFRPQPSLEPSLEPSSVEETYVAPTIDLLPLIEPEQPKRDELVAEQKPKRRKSAKANPDVDMAAFEEFWRACPKRQAKPVALAAYAAAIERGASAGQLLIAMRRYADHMRAVGTEDRYIKTPGPWLNAERYVDEYPDQAPDDGDIRAPPQPSGRPQPPSIYDAIRRVSARFEDFES